MKKYFLFLFLFGLTINICAQTLYLDSVFSAVEKHTFTYSIQNKDTLKFDFYQANPVAQNMPLFVYVHGGGFAMGTKDSKEIVTFLSRIAARGYAVASVSYKLTMKGQGFGCDIPASQKIDAINSTSQDVSYAIRYILNDSKQFNIDLKKIILCGSSAGAETVLNMAYVYDNKLLPDVKYAGVIGMAGAIISVAKITNETAIPTQLFHGTADKLVPYNINGHRYCDTDSPGFLTLFGSASIANSLKQLNTPYYFYSINGGGHEWAGFPMSKCFNEIVDFLYHDVMNVKKIRKIECNITDVP